MRLYTFRKTNHLFGSPFRLGQDEPPPPAPEPEPPPPAPEPPPEPPAPEPEPVLEPLSPPVTTCRPVGKVFIENQICYQIFECTTNGVITYEKRNAACPTPRPVYEVYYNYPYPYAYPVTTYPPAPTEIVIEDGVRPAPSLKDVAPYAIGGLAAAALLYAVLK